MEFIQAKEIVPKTYLYRLNDLVSGMNGFPWYFLSKDVSYSSDDFKFGGDDLLDMPDSQKSLGFTHLLLDQGGVESPYLPYFYGLVDTVKDLFPVPVEIFRLRLALQLANGNTNHNAPHTDHESNHYTGLFYFHDSDGETVLFEQKDDPDKGTINERWLKGRQQQYTEWKRITPEAGKFVCFDGHRYHASSNPIVNNYRVVLNFNFWSDYDILDAYETNNI